MPQCQFPIFCCFLFQKSYKENIRGIEKGKGQSQYFTRSFQKPEGEEEMGHRGPTPPRRDQGSTRAWVGCDPPGHLPAPPFRLFIPSTRKTLTISANSPEKFRHRHHIESKFRGTEVSVPAPCRDGEVPPEGSPSTPPPSSSPLLTPMMRSE